MEHQRDNLIGVLQTVWLWRKAIRNICLLTAVVSVVVSLLLPNYYRSTAICYPASPELANPELLFGTSNQVTKYYGTDQDLDRLAEIANSNALVDFMVAKFDLYRHYDIDSTTQEGAFKVRKQFRKLYVAQKNKNEALEISMEDTDPQLAAQMANAALQITDEMARKLNTESQGRLIAAIEENIKRKQTELKRLEDSLRITQAFYGIYDPVAQGEQLAIYLSTAESEVVKLRARLEVLEPNLDIPRDTIAYIKANLKAAEQQRRMLTRGGGSAEEPGSVNPLTLERYSAGLGALQVLRDLHYQARKQLSYDLERYYQIKAVYHTPISAIHVVEKAEPALRKNRPVRSLIVVGSVIAAFLLMALAALIAEAYKDVNWDKTLNRS